MPDLIERLRDIDAKEWPIAAEETAYEAASALEAMRDALRTAATNIKAQVLVANQYAKDAAPKDKIGASVWEIQNSHFSDIARVIDAALRKLDGKGK